MKTHEIHSARMAPEDRAFFTEFGASAVLALAIILLA